MKPPARITFSSVALCLALGIAGGIYADRQLRGEPSPAAAVMPRELTSYRDVVKRVVPAVVSIESKAKPGARRAAADNEDGPRGENLGFGSGFVIDPKGVILTNYHVIDGADSVEVQLPDGRKFTSRDIRGDKKTDLAVIRVTPKVDLPWLEMGDSDAMEVGDRVLAVGAPFGLTGSVTHGIVSAKSRNLRMNMYEDFLQTDAAINPGNSGGPLINLEGKVIGINSAIKSRSGGFQGVSLAISSNLVKSVSEQLLRDGTVKRGYLGVQIRDIEPDVAPKLGVADGQGVVISRLFDDAPASKAGVEEGDVVQSIGGKPIKDGRDLQKVVSALPLGKPAEVKVIRDGKPVTLSLKIEEQPEQMGGGLRLKVPQVPRRDPNSVTLGKFGLEVTDMSADYAEGLNMKEGQRGALVLKVEPGSAAEKAGLSRGSVITKVEQLSVKTVGGLKELLGKFKDEKSLLLQVKTPLGGTGYLVLHEGE
jgi:serine protease Do